MNYLKGRIKALEMIGPWTAITTKQISSKVTDNTFIIILERQTEIGSVKTL